ncbi:MAG: DUF1566 domain-containing protein [bacterium]|nr:DUF1566 domain-containing protein [bacterium]
MIKRILLMISLVFLFSSIFSAEKDRLAVMDVQDEANLFNKKTIANVTDYIFTKLQGTKIYWMVPKADRDTALEQAIEETVKGSRRECVDEKCQLSLVAQLQANFLINTKIKKLYQGTCNISISKFDVEKRAGVDSWTTDFNCSEKGVFEAINSFDFGGKKEQVGIVKQDDTADKNACKYAKEKDSVKIWQEYLNEYPGGICVFEAKNKISENSDETHKKEDVLVQQTIDFLRGAECLSVEDENKAYLKLVQSIKDLKYIWEKRDSTVSKSLSSEKKLKDKRALLLDNLKEEWGAFKNRCIENFTKIKMLNNRSDLSWSSKTTEKMNWFEAKDYCENSKEGGYSDWRLPTISELRSIIINCSPTEPGGTCKVTDTCLSSTCMDGSCNGCSILKEHSKIDDKEMIWSYSSVQSFDYAAWYVNFYDGHIQPNRKSNLLYVRCVR